MRATIAISTTIDGSPTVSAIDPVNRSIGDFVIRLGRSDVYVTRDWAEALHKALGEALTEAS